MAKNANIKKSTTEIKYYKILLLATTSWDTFRDNIDSRMSFFSRTNDCHRTSYFSGPADAIPSSLEYTQDNNIRGMVLANSSSWVCIFLFFFIFTDARTVCAPCSCGTYEWVYFPWQSSLKVMCSHSVQASIHFYPTNHPSRQPKCIAYLFIYLVFRCFSRTLSLFSSAHFSFVRFFPAFLALVVATTRWQQQRWWWWRRQQRCQLRDDCQPGLKICAR